MSFGALLRFVPYFRMLGNNIPISPPPMGHSTHFHAPHSPLPRVEASNGQPAHMADVAEWRRAACHTGSPDAGRDEAAVER